MGYKYLLLLVLFFLFHQIYSQSSSIDDGRMDNTVRIVTGGLSPGERIYTKPLPAKQLRGNPYLYDDWRTGSISVEGYKTLNPQAVKYDLLNNFLEVKVDGKVKAIDGIIVNQFSLENPDVGEKQLFVKCNDHKSDETTFIGFCQYLVKGDVNLIKRDFATIRKANYNAVVMTGERDDKIIKREAYYLTMGNEMIEVKNNKDLKSFFYKRDWNIKQYTKNHDFDYRDESDLIDLVEYYNHNF